LKKHLEYRLVATMEEKSVGGVANSAQVAKQKAWRLNSFSTRINVRKEAKADYILSFQR